MVIYTCEKCNKQFKQKGHLAEHLNKKKPCHKITIINQILPNITEINQNKNILVNDDNDCSCDYCGKLFVNIYSLKRHIDNRCKIKKEDDENKQNIFNLLLEKEQLLEKEKIINNLQNKVDEQQKEMSELKTQLQNLTKSIKELSNKTTVVNNNYGNINNIVVPTDKLSKFGKEDLNKISQQEFLKIRNQQGIAIFKECAKLIYNNKPFNRTVYVTDHSRKKAMIWDGRDWILSDLDEVINIMREKIRDLYNLKLGDIEDERIIKDFETRIQKYFDMLYDEYADEKEDDKQFMERVKGLQNKFENELIIWLSNIKKDVIENYNNILQSILINNNKLIEQKKIVDIDTNTVQKINIPRKKGRPKKII